MPKSKEVLSSTSGSDSDSEVETKVCTLKKVMIFVSYVLKLENDLTVTVFKGTKHMWLNEYKRLAW